jgi:hypothetical protein
MLKNHDKIVPGLPANRMEDLLLLKIKALESTDAGKGQDQSDQKNDLQLAVQLLLA